MRTREKNSLRGKKKLRRHSISDGDLSGPSRSRELDRAARDAERNFGELGTRNRDLNSDRSEPTGRDRDPIRRDRDRSRDRDDRARSSRRLRSDVDLRRTRPRAGSLGRVTDPAEAQHDVMFNNRRKVAFESGLAGALFQTPEQFNDVVNPTIDSLKAIILAPLKRVAEGNPTKSDWAFFTALSNDPNTLRAFAERTRSTGKFPLTVKATIDSKDQAQKFIRYLERVLSHQYPDPDALDHEFEQQLALEEKLTLIYNFSDFMTRPYKFDKDLKKPTDVEFVDKSISNEIFQLWSRFKVHGGIPGLFDDTDKHASESRFQRFNKVEGVSIASNLSEGQSGLFPVRAGRPQDPQNPHSELVADYVNTPFYNITGVGLWQPGIAGSRMERLSEEQRDELRSKIEKIKREEANAQGLDQLDRDRRLNHLRQTLEQDEKRGTDLFNRQRDFAYEAMYKHDMPLIGGASGGIGSYLLTFKVIGKLQGKQLQKAFLAAASVMMGKGYHSFHELATVANKLGVDYRPGDYASAITEEFLADHAGVRDVALKFPETILGPALNQLLATVDSIALGLSEGASWRRRVEALSGRLKLYNRIIDSEPSAEARSEALDTFNSYLDDMGIAKDDLDFLLTVGPEQAAGIRLAKPPKISGETIGKMTVALENVVDRIKASRDREIDISDVKRKLIEAIENWTLEYNSLPLRNVRAREAALDQINELVEDQLGMDMGEFNEFLKGGNTLFRV